jgi:hypothetical protein
MSQSLLEHLDEVADRLTGAPAVLLCSYFDGTLAPLACAAEMAGSPPPLTCPCGPPDGAATVSLPQ